MAASISLLIFLVFWVQVPEIFANEDCKTPNNQPGQCVILNNCPQLFALAMSNAKTNQTENYLKKSHCGFVSIVFPKVCCPIGYLGPSSPIQRSPKSAHLHNGGLSKCGMYFDDKMFRPPGEAALDQNPWDVLIESETSDGQRAFACGGVLIDERHVLTAAHCLKSSAGTKIVSVRVGEYNTESDPDCDYSYYGECTDSPMNIPVEKSIPHGDYKSGDPNQLHDIALLRLKRNVPLKMGFIFPACLPMENLVRNHTGQTLPLGGWGKIRANSHHFIKRAGYALIWDKSVCNRVFNASLGEGQFCAGGRKGQNFYDAYPGDTGGVLLDIPGRDLHGFSALGVLSVAPPCCDMEKHPRIYTNVTHYIGWINSEIKR